MSMNTTQIITWAIESLIFAFLGIIIMFICYFVIDKCTAFSLKKEIIEDENISLGIMFAGFFVAVAIIIAASIIG